MTYYIKRTVGIFLAFTVFIACSNVEKRNPDFLPPISIQIPDEIKEETELVKMISSSEIAINELSDNLEQLIIDSKEVLEKKEEDRSLMDNIKVGKLMVEFVSNSSKLGALIDEFDTYIYDQSANEILNNAQIKSLEKVVESFSERMHQINKKYEHYLE